jgi:hypothetical protein
MSARKAVEHLLLPAQMSTNYFMFVAMRGRVAGLPPPTGRCRAPRSARTAAGGHAPRGGGRRSALRADSPLRFAPLRCANHLPHAAGLSHMNLRLHRLLLARGDAETQRGSIEPPRRQVREGIPALLRAQFSSWRLGVLAVSLRGSAPPRAYAIALPHVGGGKPGSLLLFAISNTHNFFIPAKAGTQAPEFTGQGGALDSRFRGHDNEGRRSDTVPSQNALIRATSMPGAECCWSGG